MYLISITMDLVSKKIEDTLKRFDLLVSERASNYLRITNVDKKNNIYIEQTPNDFYDVVVNGSSHRNVPLNGVSHLIITELSID